MPKATVMSLPKAFLRQREESRQRITSPQGILLRMNRSIQVKGAFGVIKQDMDFRRFLTREKKCLYRNASCLPSDTIWANGITKRRTTAYGRSCSKNLRLKSAWKWKIFHILGLTLAFSWLFSTFICYFWFFWELKMGPTGWFSESLIRRPLSLVQCGWL